MKFGFVAKHRGTWPVRMVCDMLGVSRSGFYAWRVRPESKRVQHDAVIARAMCASFTLSERTYGARRLGYDRWALGFTIGLHHVERLMRAHALRARPRRRALPRDPGARALQAIAPNVLDRAFTATAPNQKWVADFTYVWTHEGWLDVAVVLDLFSRRVVGWSMQATMTAPLVTDALWKASSPPSRPNARPENTRRHVMPHARTSLTSWSASTIRFGDTRRSTTSAAPCRSKMQSLSRVSTEHGTAHQRQTPHRSTARHFSYLYTSQHFTQ